MILRIIVCTGQVVILLTQITKYMSLSRNRKISTTEAFTGGEAPIQVFSSIVFSSIQVFSSFLRAHIIQNICKRLLLNRKLNWSREGCFLSQGIRTTIDTRVTKDRLEFPLLDLEKTESHYESIYKISIFLKPLA